MAGHPTSSAEPPSALPSGTVAFLYTDVEGSTRLWEASADAARPAIARHEALLRETVAAHGGVVYRTQGDGICAAFATASSAVAAALAGQRALATEAWQTPAPIRVRMGLHAGAVEIQGGDYAGPCLNRVARLLGIGHGGQVLASEVVAELARDDLPEGVALQDLGEHRLRDLVRPERVFQLLHPELPSLFPPLKTLDQYPNNLPLQLTSFVGREREMAEVKRLLKTSRLVTLTGIGGCGKTRLSVQVAADLLDEHPDGVFLAGLDSVGEPALVAVTVASALGVREDVRRSAEGSLVRHLQGKHALLILDNCEHLVEECARLADSLLHACPSLQILATSREALGIQGEVFYRVPSLSLPDSRHLPPPGQLSQYESVRLFLDRAQAVNPSFRVSSANASAVAQIAWRLDGIPLAIELAAAKTRLLTPEQIARRLDDQFRLLAGGSRTAMPRQQTLRAAIDWSYSLLSPSEQTLFRRLAVFSGGFSLEAAEVACSAPPLGPFDVLELLSSLVDKSLVLVDQPEDAPEDGTEDASGEAAGGGSGEMRYRLLETIRQYARDRLLEADEAQATRDRHLSFFVDFAEAAKPELEGAQQGTWLNALEAEIGNLRTALEWSLEASPSLGVRLAGSLMRYWQVRERIGEAHQWLVDTLGRAPARTAARADALLGVAILGSAIGHADDEVPRLEEALSIYRELNDRRGVAWALENLGAAIAARGDFARARALLDESLAISREIGDSRRSGWALRALGANAVSQADYREAEALYKESLALFESTGETWGAALCGGTLGTFAHSLGQHDLARSHFEESLRLFVETGSRGNQAATLVHLGKVSASTGDFPRARREIELGLGLFADLDAPEMVAWATAWLGSLAASAGALDEARSRLSEALRHLSALGAGDASMVALAQAVAAALSSQLGDLAQAADLARKSLAYFRRVHYHPGLAHCLCRLGLLAIARGDLSRGIRAIASAARLDPLLGGAHFPDTRAEREESLGKARAALGDETYAQAWAAGSQMSLDEAIESVT
jgi:predicted ATPase/class 3 adenylate cyclase